MALVVFLGVFLLFVFFAMLVLLARHLLFRILAYRLQADCLGDLDPDTRRLLDRSGSPVEVGRLAADRNRRRTKLRAGTLLVREWDGRSSGSSCSPTALPGTENLIEAFPGRLRHDRHAMEWPADGCIPFFYDCKGCGT